MQHSGRSARGGLHFSNKSAKMVTIDKTESTLAGAGFYRNPERHFNNITVCESGVVISVKSSLNMSSCSATDYDELN